jgi:nucleotide-binding universal stress UspA family protein
MKGLPMFSHALVATDLGPSSEALVACAGELGILGVRDVILVHAIDIDRAPSPADDAAFARQIDSLERAGIRVHVETPLGYPPHAITALAEQHGVGVIVMGTHGQGLFPTGFSGSISSDVVRLSSVPVLLMPAHEHDSAQAGTRACSRILSSVLVPIDVTESSEKICTLACGLAPRGMGRLEMLNVTPFTFEAAREGREEEAHRRLEMLAERARGHGVRNVITTVLRGDATDLVPGRVVSGDYSLVVLAPRCRDVTEREFGSVAGAVLQVSPIPLLLAPIMCPPDGPQGAGNT